MGQHRTFSSWCAGLKLFNWMVLSLPFLLKFPNFGLVNVTVSKKTHLPRAKILRNFYVNPNGFWTPSERHLNAFERVRFFTHMNGYGFFHTWLVFYTHVRDFTYPFFTHGSKKSENFRVAFFSQKSSKIIKKWFKLPNTLCSWTIHKARGQTAFHLDGKLRDRLALKYFTTWHRPASSQSVNGSRPRSSWAGSGHRSSGLGWPSPWVVSWGISSTTRCPNRRG